MNFRRLLLLLPLCAACASTDELEPDPLSYHLAVMPIESATIGRATPGEHPGEETELVLELPGASVHTAIAETLQRYCFTRVTLLDAEGPIEASAEVPFSREDAIMERARAAGADLVLELSLRYEPSVYRDTNGSFWLNFPLFLFAGPTNWFISDNTYYADVELTSTVYDAGSLEAGLTLDDPAAHVVRVTSKFSGIALDFIDRADDAGDYALGIICPSGFLARENESALEELRREILDALCSQTVQGLQSRRDDLVRAEFAAPFYVDPNEVSIVAEGESALRVRGRVQLRRDGDAENVKAVHVLAGGAETRAVLRAPEAGVSGYDAYPFEAVLATGAEDSRVRLIVEGGGRDAYVRTYTFDPARIDRE